MAQAPGFLHTQRKHPGTAWKTAAVKSPLQGTPRLPKTRELLPKWKKTAPSDHSHHKASPLGKAPITTALGYINLQVLCAAAGMSVSRVGPINPLQPPASCVTPQLLLAKQTPKVMPLAGHPAREGRNHRPQQAQARARCFIYLFIYTGKEFHIPSLLLL